MRSLLTYVVIITLFAGASWLVLDYGKTLPLAAGPVVASQSKTASGPSLQILLIQITITLAAARLFGAIARRLRQPTVIGEIVAGVILGPTLLGHVAPSLFAAAFPDGSLP